MKKYTHRIDDDFGLGLDFIMLTIGPSDQIYRNWSKSRKEKFHSLVFKSLWVSKENVVKY